MILEMSTKDPLSYKVIGCAMEVYNTLGTGLLESAYEKALIPLGCLSISMSTIFAME